MSNFEEEIDQLKEMLSKKGVKEMLSKKGDAALYAKCLAVREAHDAELDEAQESLRKVKGELDEMRQARDRVSSERAKLLNRPAGLERLWDHPDGRRILEAAFAHDPNGTRIALQYLGGDLIAGELRDQALTSERQTELQLS